MITGKVVSRSDTTGAFSSDERQTLLACPSISFQVIGQTLNFPAVVAFHQYPPIPSRGDLGADLGGGGDDGAVIHELKLDIL